MNHNKIVPANSKYVDSFSHHFQIIYMPVANMNIGVLLQNPSSNWQYTCQWWEAGTEQAPSSNGRRSSAMGRLLRQTRPGPYSGRPIPCAVRFSLLALHAILSWRARTNLGRASSILCYITGRKLQQLVFWGPVLNFQKRNNFYLHAIFLGNDNIQSAIFRS